MAIYRTWLEEEIPHLDDNNNPDDQIKELEKIVADTDANEAEQEEAQEASFGPDGGVDDIMEESWIAIAEFESGTNDIMKAIAYHELNEAAEGRDFMLESWDDIKGFFKNIKDKIVAFFKKVWSVIQRWAGNVMAAVTTNKKFAEKYSSEIATGYNLIQREKGRKKMKGYKFPDLSKRIANIKSSEVGKIFDKATFKYEDLKDESTHGTPEEYEAIINDFCRDIVGEECTKNEVSTKLKNVLFSDSTKEAKPVEYWMEPKLIIEVLQGRKDDVKTVKDFMKDAKSEFKDALDTLKDLERDVSKEDDTVKRNKMMSEVLRGTTCIRTISSITQIARTQFIRAINARARQARRYGMAYVAACNKKNHQGFNKDSHWKNESSQYGFLGNIGLI